MIGTGFVLIVVLGGLKQGAESHLLVTNRMDVLTNRSRNQFINALKRRMQGERYRFDELLQGIGQGMPVRSY